MGNIVLVGAGGTGMSGVAGMLNELGFKNIICIDNTQSQLTDKLIQKGLKVIIGHGNYTPQIDDTIIYSEAVAQSPEVLQARKLITEHKKMMFIMNYFQFLGEISKYFTTIGITGTNGKSSTTALALYGAKNLQNFGIGILGALVPDFDNQSYLINPSHKETIKTMFTKILTGKAQEISNSIKSLLFIVEACEYKRHFLNLDLDYTAITSLEFDHADYYKDFDDYIDAFVQLSATIKKEIFILDSDTSEGIQKLQQKLNNQHMKRTPIHEEHTEFEYIFGPHVDKNTSLVKAILTSQDKDFDITTLKSFKGLRRRLEYLGTTDNKTQVFSDYGHMASSLHIGYQALKKKFPDKKLIAVFQPHQITRIFTGWDDFKTNLKGFDQVIIYDIYAARENLEDFDFSRRGTNIHNIEELGHVFAQDCGGKYISERSMLKQEIKKLDKDNILAIFSAGDIDYKLRTDLQLS